MPLLVTNRGFTPGAVSQVAHTVFYVFGGRYSGAADDTTTDASFEYGFSAGPFAFAVADGSFFDQDQADFTAQAALECDKTYKFRAHVVNALMGEFPFAAQTNFKSYAVTVTAGTPTASGITTTGATVSCVFVPNTSESSITATLQYRVFGSGAAWTSAATSGYVTSGYVSTTASATLSGLSCEGFYEVRLVVVRTTTNDTTFTSEPGTFQTASCAPTIVTMPASDITTVPTQVSARLNGSVDPNGIACTVYFGWDTVDHSSDRNWSNFTAAQAQTGDGARQFVDQISGLTIATTYYFQAFVSETVLATRHHWGETLSFITRPSRHIDAEKYELMHIYEYEGKTGVASTFYFTLQRPSSIDSDRLVTTAPASLFVAGDIKVSIDGAAFTSVLIASVVQVAALNPLYYLTLTAAQMLGTNIVVQIVDQDGPAFRDAFIIVRTKLLLGQVDVDATQLGGNNSALLLTGVGTAPGVTIRGGASSSTDITGVSGEVLRRGTAAGGSGLTITLDSGASSTDDFYNGLCVGIVAGTGVGQSRIITDYVGATKVATVNRAWSAPPSLGASTFAIFPGHEVWDLHAAGELVGLPTDSATFADFIQFIFQRFAYLRDETSSLFKMYKKDGTTVLAQGGVSDDGTIQTANKLI